MRCRFVPPRGQSDPVEASGPIGECVEYSKCRRRHRTTCALPLQGHIPDGLGRAATSVTRDMNDKLLGLFITWTCYGTWLPGDDRGWTKWHKGEHVPQPILADWCRKQMSERPIVLSAEQREIVNRVIEEHCSKRGWILHQVNCRSNHCHVVVTAPGLDGDTVRDQLKAWSTRKLKENERTQGIAEDKRREHWWTRKGSVRRLDDEESLEAAILYVRDAQDIGGSKYDK